MHQLKAYIRYIYDLGNGTSFLIDLEIMNKDTKTVIGQDKHEITFSGGFAKTAACKAATIAFIIDYVVNLYDEDFPGIEMDASDIFLKDFDFIKVPELYNNSASTASGHVVFYLTDTKASGGNALYSAVDLNAIQLTVNKKTQVCPTEAVTLSSDKKTLTIDVNKLTLSLGILDITQTAANGIPVGVMLVGTPA